MRVWKGLLGGDLTKTEVEMIVVENQVQDKANHLQTWFDQWLSSKTIFLKKLVIWAKHITVISLNYVENVQVFNK